LEFGVWLLGEGYAESTVAGRVKLLRLLVRRGADLYDLDSVKRVISVQGWSDGRKANVVDAYRCWLRWKGLPTDGLPRYVKKRKQLNSSKPGSNTSRK